MPEMMIDSYIGVDVSKNTLDLFNEKTMRKEQFYNNSAGHDALVKYLQLQTNIMLICEATGDYHLELLKVIQGAKILIAVINPRQVRDFAKAKGVLSKTDSIDAKILSEFGRSLTPEPLEFMSQNDFDLKELQARISQITKMIAMERTRMTHTNNENNKRSITLTIQFLEKQLKEFEKLSAEIIASIEELKEKKELLESVPGIGAKTAVSLIVLLPELGKLGFKQISKLIGVAPLNRDSGMMRGKRCIWGGRASVRCALYMPTLTAIRSNPIIKALYLKLKNKGSSHKQALIACMHKLIGILTGVVKNKQKWIYLDA
jgi:transposase